MCNHIIKIGLVAAPGVTETIANHLQQELPSLLSSTINSEVEWQIDTMIDPLTGSAETVQKIYTKISDNQNDNEWQYTIGLTDLPIIKNKHVVAFDINSKNGASLISLPCIWLAPHKKELSIPYRALLKQLTKI